jgi:hypothetical protein
LNSLFFSYLYIESISGAGSRPYDAKVRNPVKFEGVRSGGAKFEDFTFVRFTPWDPITLGQWKHVTKALDRPELTEEERKPKWGEKWNIALREIDFRKLNVDQVEAMIRAGKEVKQQ